MTENSRKKVVFFENEPAMPYEGADALPGLILENSELGREVETSRVFTIEKLRSALRDPDNSVVVVDLPLEDEAQNRLMADLLSIASQHPTLAICIYSFIAPNSSIEDTFPTFSKGNDNQELYDYLHEVMSS